jgi:hypothetical protein
MLVGCDFELIFKIYLWSEYWFKQNGHPGNAHYYTEM